ncbi:MAG: hypothetical protein NWF00_11860 [Candidatus Bathyarchaeota archaeon]|nr:hypothetical protein [Candidatus Bathyarchaeota archaeon]
MRTLLRTALLSGMFVNLKGGIAEAMHSTDSLYEKVEPVDGGLLIVYQLDVYQRWIVHVRYVKGGLQFEDLFHEVVGKADESWLDNHFEEDDCYDFERLIF